MKFSRVLLVVSLVFAASVNVISCKTVDSDILSDRNGNAGKNKGGTVVSCKNNYPILNNKNIMVTDLYVLKRGEPAGEPVVNHPEGRQLSYAEITAQWVERVKFHDYFKYLELKRLIGVADPARIGQEGNLAEMPANLKMPYPGDEGYIVVPDEDDCEVLFGAVQSLSSYTKKLYHFKDRIWERLDELNRAALLSHEIFYTLYGENTDGAAIRELVSRIIANLIDSQKIDYSKFVFDELHVLDAFPAFKPEAVYMDPKNPIAPLYEGLAVKHHNYWDHNDIKYTEYLYVDGEHGQKLKAFLADGTPAEIGCVSGRYNGKFARIKDQNQGRILALEVDTYYMEDASCIPLNISSRIRFSQKGIGYSFDIRWNDATKRYEIETK